MTNILEEITKWPNRWLKRNAKAYYFYFGKETKSIEQLSHKEAYKCMKTLQANKKWLENNKKIKLK